MSGIRGAGWAASRIGDPGSGTGVVPDAVGWSRLRVWWRPRNRFGESRKAGPPGPAGVHGRDVRPFPGRSLGASRKGEE